MKRLVALLLATAMWPALPVHAETLDLATLTCKAFIARDKDSVGLVLMWLEGYYSEENATPKVDFERLKDRRAKFSEYCAKNPNQSVIDAADEIIGP